MDPVTLANLIAQLLPLGINIYNQIQQANANQLQPIELVLAAADVNWNNIIAAGQAEIAKAAKP